MGINSRVTKTETLNGAVDILLFVRYCVEHSSFEKRGHISKLRTACAINYFGTSDNRDEKLAEMISEFELRFNKSGGQDFNAMFRKIFPKKGLDKMRLNKQEYFQMKSLVGFISNRNLEGRGYHFFSDYKRVSEKTKQEIEEVFISRMEKYQSGTKENIAEILNKENEDSLSENENGLENEMDGEEKNPLHHFIDNVMFGYEEDNLSEEKEAPESLELMEFDLEKRYMNKISAKENIENRPLTRSEIDSTVKKVIGEFEAEYEGYDEKEIDAVKTMFYNRIRTNN